jgi:hypothetical protein
VVGLWIFGVERLDLYEWNGGQEYYKIEIIGNEVKGKYVLQRFQNGKDLFESSSILENASSANPFSGRIAFDGIKNLKKACKTEFKK